MKNAQEIFNIKQEKSQKQTAERLDLVEHKVDEFIEKWAAEGRIRGDYTDEQMEEMFIHPLTAVTMLRKLGFEVYKSNEVETGYLWWKKKYPAKWHIDVPIKK